jgi:sterol-4alpha-carboxylate 3-dehydrogenase (decarboxylating)
MEIKSALITGGTGFVGRAIVRALREEHPECAITIVDLQTHANGLGADYKTLFIQGDVTSYESILDAVLRCQPEVVIHTAGIVPPLGERYARRMEKEVFHVNVKGTRNTLDAAIEAGCAAFVYTSSCTAVTDDVSMPYANIDERWPTAYHSSIYGESKAVAEELVLAASGESMQTCVLRPSVICGEGDNQLVPSIHACIAKWETPYIIGDGINLWDVTYVGNIADAHVLAAENLLSIGSAAGEAFFIQNNEPVSFRDFSLAVWKHFGHVPPFEIVIPLGLAWLAGLLAECFTWISGTTTTLSRGSVKDACSVRYANGFKARKILGYRARIGIEEGLRRSCEVRLCSPPPSPSLTHHLTFCRTTLSVYCSNLKHKLVQGQTVSLGPLF